MPRHEAQMGEAIKPAAVGKELGCRSHSGSGFMRLLQTVYDKNGMKSSIYFRTRNLKSMHTLLEYIIFYEDSCMHRFQ